MDCTGTSVESGRVFEWATMSIAPVLNLAGWADECRKVYRVLAQRIIRIKTLKIQPLRVRLFGQTPIFQCDSMQIGGAQYVAT